MSSLVSPTSRLIAQTPLAKSPSVSDIAAWISQVSPCLVEGGTQSGDTTAEVVIYLIAVGIHPSDIQDALARTGYQWTLTASVDRLLVTAFTKFPPKMRADNPQTTMGERSKISPMRARMKAEQLETLYNANEHNPEYQQKLREELVGVITAMDDDGGSGSDPMPGRGRLESQRDKLEETRKEILLNAARNVGAHIRQLSRYELARLKISPAPDGAWRLPPGTRTPIRRPVRGK